MSNKLVFKATYKDREGELKEVFAKHHMITKEITFFISVTPLFTIQMHSTDTLLDALNSLSQPFTKDKNGFPILVEGVSHAYEDEIK